VTSLTSTSVNGIQSGITLPPAATSRLVIAGFPSPVTAGVAGSFTVRAFGNPTPGYLGTARFTSSDPQAGLPGNYTFTAADAGVHTFSATLKAAGLQSLTVTDLANSGVSGAQGNIQVTAAAPSRLILVAPASVSANSPFSLTVTVVDAYGNVVTGYRGSLAFTCSTPTANLPKRYTFTAADQGTHTVTGLLMKKKGRQTITATEPNNSFLTATVAIQVV